MANEHSILCPLCGNKVPPGLTRCPVCATELQRTITKHTEESPKVTSDFLKKEIPGVKLLPETKHLCPQCGLELEGVESKCPRCGIPLSAEEALVECPECGALLPKDARSCNRCGFNLHEPRARAPSPPPSRAPARVSTVEVAVTTVRSTKPTVTPVMPEIPAVAEKVTPPPSPPARVEPSRPLETVTPPATSRQTSQGFVNGRGAVNGTGLVNGKGAVNGTGLVNGRGAVNGNGFTNGSRAEMRAPTQTMTKSKGIISKWQFLALLVALVVIIPTFMYLTYSQDSAPITIDGSFDDWSDAATFGMFQNSALDRLNVSAWAVKTDASNLYVYLATRGSMMSTGALDSYFVFVDVDGDNTTGYLVSSIGAEYRVQLGGWNGSVEVASTSRFVSVNGDRYDWNSWEGSGTPTEKLDANRIECSAAIPSLSSDSRYVLVTKSEQALEGISYPVREDASLLILRQEPGTGLATGIVPNLASVSALKLTLSCQGGTGTVTSIVPAVAGATPIGLDTGTINLVPGASQVVEVLVNTLSWGAGSVVSVSVFPSDVTTTFDSVVVTGNPARAYIGSAPTTIQIDGVFADWAGRVSIDTDSNMMNDPNVDIMSVGAVNTTLSSAFYASVEGEMCGGSFVPSQMTKPSSSGGGAVIPTKKTGEDILRVYLDTDMSQSTGSIVTLPSKTIGADYMIEVLGLNGRITSKSLMRFTAGNWVFASGSVNAANDEHRIELSVSSTSISLASSIEFILEMTDWRGWSDMATSDPQGTRAADMPGTRAWMVDSTINSAEATATSNQRKLFHDGTNFWSVYVDQGNAVARYSPDGITWNTDGRVFKTNGVVRPSIWYDAANFTVYVIGDRTTATVNAFLQRGVVSPAGQTIAWAPTDRVLAVSVSTNTVAVKNTFITRDAAGYVWIMAVNCTSTAPLTYDLSVFHSTVVNSIAATWTHSGNMGANSTLQTIKGSILPAGTGSSMWAVYVHDGIVASRKYTGTWGAESVLYTPTAGAGNTEDAPPSAVVDGAGVIHVVYGTDNEQPPATSRPHIQYRYNAGASWSVEELLSSGGASNGFKYPTISLDASTGNLVAFWYDMQTQYVVAKKRVASTWSSITLNAQTADPKAHLSSIYSAAAEMLICYQWTQNATGSIHVIYDKIPEFDAVLPVLGIAAIVVLVIGPIRKRRRQL